MKFICENKDAVAARVLEAIDLFLKSRCEQWAQLSVQKSGTGYQIDFETFEHEDPDDEATEEAQEHHPNCQTFDPNEVRPCNCHDGRFDEPYPADGVL